ncbi:hypothetical protein MLD38_008399 [Melastoma candidum]|uniref:Uncharacterized protein n=1 Tax=Melastoma candidum TaxID=119954 RepID=A0ACB9S2Q2_9MYRT|nr:hypothetical protein MLD38_008399 [Melastoma candidum]
MMAVSLTPSQHQAAVISSGFYSLSNNFSGFLISEPNIPGWWIWFYYICLVAWTLRGIVTSQLGDVETEVIGPGFHGTVNEYLNISLGFKSSMVLVFVVAVLGSCVLSFGLFALSIKVLNFQKR